MIERDEHGRLVFRDANGTERRPCSDAELRAVVDDILNDESIPQMHRVPGWQMNVEDLVQQAATGLAPEPIRPIVGDLLEQLRGLIGAAMKQPQAAQTQRGRPHLHVVQDDEPRKRPSKPKGAGTSTKTATPPQSGRGHRRTAIRRKSDVGNPRKFRKSEGN